MAPGYDGVLPDSGYHVSHCRTNRVCVLGRAFMVDNDPGPAVEGLKRGFRIHRYRHGAAGTSVASFLAGHAPLAQPQEPGATRFVEAVHKAMFNMLFVGGYEFMTPPPEITPEASSVPVTPPASSTRASPSTTPRPATRRRCACG